MTLWHVTDAHAVRQASRPKHAFRVAPCPALPPLPGLRCVWCEYNNSTPLVRASHAGRLHTGNPISACMPQVPHGQHGTAHAGLCVTISSGRAVQDLVYGMWACGIHDTYDQELAERAVQVVPGRLGELSGGELAKLAFALVEEDVREPELFESIKSEAVEGMPGMFPRDIAKLLYALGRAQVQPRTERPAAGVPLADVGKGVCLVHLGRCRGCSRTACRLLRRLFPPHAGAHARARRCLFPCPSMPHDMHVHESDMA